MLISNCREMLLKPRIDLRESKNKCIVYILHSSDMKICDINEAFSQ